MTTLPVPANGGRSGLSLLIRLARIAPVLAIVLTAAHAAPAQAYSGGGCVPNSAKGFSIASCISAQSMLLDQGQVYPDYYVKSVPPDANSNNCEIEWVVNHNNSTVQAGIDQCVVGHHTLGPYDTSGGGSWQLLISVYSDNGIKTPVLEADSPQQIV
jgi:hypothetical protein